MPGAWRTSRCAGLALALATAAGWAWASAPTRTAKPAAASAAPPAAQEPASAAPATDSPYVADASAPYLEYAGAWPIRYGRATRSEIQGVIVAWEVPVSRLMPRRHWEIDRPLDAQDETDFAALVKARGDGVAPASAVTLEGPRSLTFELGTPQEAADKGFGRGPGKLAGPDAAMVFRFISGTPDDANPGTVHLQRTWFAYYEPIAEETAADRRRARRAAREGTTITVQAREAVGVVVVMPGLYGTPEPVFDGLVRRLREHGFGVLRMLAQPSRFTEEARIDLDPAKMEEDAGRVAAALGDRAAECAFAVEAALVHIEGSRPELAKLPKAIMGASGGGMTLPVVYARSPERYSAAVLIGSAADLWLIARRSAYTNDARSLSIRLKGQARIADESTPGYDWRAFDAMYLDRAALDPFHTAKAMQGRKVLMFHGEQDLAVPAQLGDLLWERLGKPERWSYPTGHEGLIIEMLPRDTDKIIAWIKGSMGIDEQKP